ncbi:MAG: VOC family protein [Dehalococcoidia bacterium]
MKITALRSWNMNSKDIEASRRFYRDLLGAGGDDSKQQVRGVDVYRLKAGAGGIGIFDAAGGPQVGVPHHTFEIDGPDDPEALKQELEAKGIEVEGIRPHRDGGYSIYLSDPDGNRLELSKG